MCGSMMGRALQWAEARFSSLPVDHKAYDEFVDERKMVFDHLDYDTNSSHRLENLKTGGAICIRLFSWILNLGSWC